MPIAVDDFISGRRGCESFVKYPDFIFPRERPAPPIDPSWARYWRRVAEYEAHQIKKREAARRAATGSRAYSPDRDDHEWLAQNYAPKENA